MKSEQTIPQHIAVIMDGNGRWATRRGMKRHEGHRVGVESARTLVTHCRKIGVRHLTLYTFSTENWARPEEEKRVLFDLLVRFLKGELSSLLEQDIRLRILGEIERFPLAVREMLKHVLRKTAHCKSMTLNLALNYGGRDEILRAAQTLAGQGLRPEEITPEVFADALYTHGQPDPELIIRTSGEKRISNFLLWQAAYSEFYFTDTLWPDFTPEELDKALEEFSSRQRRFGKTGEQVED
ncbi:isoprenyl transferase [Paucidesulfovibrio longus]|uniref:isoprenyl transferase n=1 Tax=Paucidesulfovibrio longus TaxID=889 RepID=UPI0003B71324|nr:isoprenyl transferase [Paucidesulfovibrio longus]